MWPVGQQPVYHRPDKLHIVGSMLEKAYHQADDSIDEIAALLAA
jgi:hypothetical protein